MEKEIWEESKFYGIVYDLDGKYTDEEAEQIKSQYISKYGNIFLCTFFSDDNFFRNFINNIPEEEQEKYIENTIKYQIDKKCDKNYVIVGRRAVPSYESKPENFWTTEANEVFRGLRNEIQKEQRLHSVIMVSTLGRLIEHGLSDTVGKGGSDGEIVIDPNKNFNQFLFMYKPRDEFWQLFDYLESGGTTREELLVQLRETAIERAKKQGLQIKTENQQTITISEIEESTAGETLSGINEESRYLKDREAQKDFEQEEDGWSQEDDW